MGKCKMQDCCTGNLIVVLTSVLDPNADPEELESGSINFLPLSEKKITSTLKLKKLPVL